MKLVAVTACPTGIAHTYMAAEKLSRTAETLGHEIKVETRGSIGIENELTDADIAAADGVIIAADTEVSRDRFAGKRLIAVGVARGINRPQELFEEVGRAPVWRPGSASEPPTGDAARPTAAAPGQPTKQRSPVYKALMNGVSYMIPFVVVGGLLIAVSLALGGEPDPAGGLVIPEGSFWARVNQVGVVGFTLMVPILSGYIAYAIADRPGLAPGMVCGWIANNGSFYDSEAGAGFIGAIVTGFAAGYLALWIKRLRVPRPVQPIMPIIVIPLLVTLVVGGLFIFLLGQPIAAAFSALTGFLSSLQGGSAALLGLVIGLMIAFDMGGPVNKTAFLFGASLIAAGNTAVMGIAAAAIPVPPLGMGLATLLRARLFTEQEHELGYAALFMGFFGITEGAIPFAAADPARVIPSIMAGGAVAGALAGLAGATDAVPHGGLIVALLGAVGNVAWYVLAILLGTAVTALLVIALKALAGGPAATADATADAAAGARA
jgi:PTS system fructose-specific IIC component